MFPVMKCNIRNKVLFGLRTVAGNDSGCSDTYMDTRVIGVLQSLVTDQRCEHVLLDCERRLMQAQWLG